MGTKPKLRFFIRKLRKSLRKSFTPHQWRVLLALGMVNLVAGLIDSFQTPSNYDTTLKSVSSENGTTRHHPYSLRVAGEGDSENERQSNATDGLFISGVDITRFLVSPVLGVTLHLIGPKNAFLAGVCTDASSTTIFGLIQKIPNTTLRSIFSVVSGIIVAAGTSVTSIAIYTLLTMEFPRTIAIAFAIIQTMNLFGKTIGPSVASIMVTLAGDSLPFLALGIGHYLLAIATYSILPDSNEVEASDKRRSTTPEKKSTISGDVAESEVKGHEDEEIEPAPKAALAPPPLSSRGKLSAKLGILTMIVSGVKSLFSKSDGDASKRGIRGYISLLNIRPVQMYCFGVIMSALISGFVTSILKPHLLQFSMADKAKAPVGGIFLIFACVSSLSSIVWGFLVGRVRRPEFLALVGVLLIFLSVLPIGPIPFILSLQPNVKWSTVSLIMMGLGLGGVNIAAFVLCLDEAKHRGFPEDGSTSGMISSLFVASMALGVFAGPALGTRLYNNVGFKDASIFIFLISLVQMLVFGFFVCSKKPLPPQKVEESEDEDEEDDEESPLLSSAEKIKTAKYYFHVTN